MLSELSLCNRSQDGQARMEQSTAACVWDLAGTHLHADGEGLHLNVSRGSDLRGGLRLAVNGQEKQLGIFTTCFLQQKQSSQCRKEACVSPAPHDQSPLQVVVIAGTNLILVQQLVSNLVSHRGQIGGVQVKDDCTCRAVEQLSPWTPSSIHQHAAFSFFYF